MPTVKMLQQKDSGALFPYTDILASRDDMTVVEINQKNLTPKPPIEIEPLKLLLDKKHRVGKGWVRNRRGNWTRIKQ